MYNKSGKIEKYNKNEKVGIYNKNLESLKTALNVYITKEKYDNILAVYIMGSSVRRTEFNDYDVNVFVKDDSFTEIKKLEDLKIYLEEKTNKKIDYNVVSIDNISNNMLNTDLFIHKNRHSMLLYELTTVKNLIYGKDVLADYKVYYCDIIYESLNLAMTQIHRLNKEYLAKNKESAYKNARKYLKYSIEFAMIFSGVKNPYIGLSKETVLKKFPSLKEYETEIEKALNNENVNLEKAYDCMVNLRTEMLLRFKYLVTYVTESKGIELNDKLSCDYFEFRNVEELEMFRSSYLGQWKYKRVLFD